MITIVVAHDHYNIQEGQVLISHNYGGKIQNASFTSMYVAKKK